MPQFPFNIVMGYFLDFFCTFVSLYRMIIQSYSKKLVTEFCICVCFTYVCVSVEMLLLCLDLETVLSQVDTDILEDHKTSVLKAIRSKLSLKAVFPTRLHGVRTHKTTF